IGRLNTDGSVDPSFDSGTGPNGLVYSVALQPDGKLLIGGEFTGVNGTSRNHIARLNANGSLDTSFNLTGTGANDSVNSVVVQTDGKAVIGGAFASVNGAARGRVARLTSLIETNLSGGGALTNGVTHAGTIILGNPDRWTLAAKSGDT